MDWKVVYEDLKFRNWIILFILSLFSYILLSPEQTLGTIIGGLLIIANFRIFQHSICRIFKNTDLIRINKISIILKYYIRLIALGLIIFILLMKGWVDPIGLTLGLSTLVISITILGIGMAFKKEDEEAS
jgi:hypothetical protein